MSTDDNTKIDSDDSSAPQDPSHDQELPDLVETMDSVDTNSPEAKENATSMSDGKGGRIKFNEDMAKNPKSKIIRGVEVIKNTIKGVEDND